MKTLALILCLILAGCGAAYFSAKTEASYQITKDGKLITYSSTKEQQGLDMDLTEENGQVKTVKIHVDKASTNEQAIAAALAATAAALQTVTDLIKTGAAAAAAGS